MQNLIDNSLLQSVSEIYDYKDKFIFQNPEIEQKLVSDLSSIAAFFAVDHKVAAVFSIIICDQLSGESFSVTKIMKNLGFKPLEFMKTIEELNQWKSKGLLRSTMRRSSKPTNEYIFSKEVIDAVIYNDILKLNIEIPDNQSEAFLNIRTFINNILVTVEKDYVVDVLMNHVYKYKQFKLIKEILDNDDIHEIEKVILFYIIAYAQYGVQEFDLDLILDYFDDESNLHFRFKQRVSSEKSKLFTDGYLEFEVPGFIDFSIILPGEKLKKHINFDLNKSEQNTFTPKYSTLIKPESIETINLFFNTDTQKLIDGFYY